MMWLGRWTCGSCVGSPGSPGVRGRCALCPAPLVLATPPLHGAWQWGMQPQRLWAERPGPALCCCTYVQAGPPHAEMRRGGVMPGCMRARDVAELEREALAQLQHLPMDHQVGPWTVGTAKASFPVLFWVLLGAPS